MPRAYSIKTTLTVTDLKYYLEHFCYQNLNSFSQSFVKIELLNIDTRYMYILSVIFNFD